MQVKCQWCQFTFTLSREALAVALETIQDSSAKHYTLECPKCRHTVKIPVRQVRRSLPAAGNAESDES